MFTSLLLCLGMFTKAYTLLSEETWEKGPNTNNPVESINKQSIIFPEKGNSLQPLLLLLENK